MPNILFLIIPTVAFNTILLAFFLAKKISRQQTRIQQTNQQSETPTAATPRKIPVKTIIGIVIVIAILGIFFSIPGDTSNKIETVKSVIPREEEIPPTTAVICIDDFEEEARGKDRIKTGDYTETFVNNKGHLIVRTTDDDWSATIYLALDEKLQEKKVIEMECTIKVSGSGQNAFGGYTKDDPLQRFTFNGKKINLFSNKKMKEDPRCPGVENEEKYKTVLTRIVSNDNKTAELRTLVIPTTGEYLLTMTYNLFQKNLTRIGIDFYSKDRESQLEISEIIVKVSEN